VNMLFLVWRLDADDASVRRRIDGPRLGRHDSLFVLLEKAMPSGDWMSRLGGMLLVAWGVANLVRMI